MLVAATLAATLACAASPLDSPNVVLIVVDTLRPDHMSTYGYERKTTPNISRLAQDSILFRNAWSTAPWTLPSVGSLLTSQYPSALGIRDNIVPLDRRFELLPEVLQRHGYRTHGIVSSALLSARLGFGRGFDHYDESSSLFHSGSSSREVTRKAVEFLKARDDRPFFLFLHYFDPHYNYELHPRFRFGSGYRRACEAATRFWTSGESATSSTRLISASSSRSTTRRSPTRTSPSECCWTSSGSSASTTTRSSS